MNSISKHITYKEATKSVTALRLGIENVPNEYELQNMELIAEKVFEPLRRAVNGPIKINSFFRCEELNKAIGGSSKSQHCQGRAIDIDDVYGYVSNSYMYYYIKDNLDFDQLIWEFGTDIEPDWVHVSYVDGDSNRKRCLLAYKENGKTKYKDISHV
jgi:zinc D-Ala-D-Ala carboxypeptidase